MSIAQRFNLRFVAILLLYGSIVYVVYRDEVLATLLAPIARFTALMTSQLIHCLGIETIRQGAVLIHPNGFCYEIAYTCTGLLPATTFIVCIVAYPSTLRDKWLGIIIGVPSLFGVNYLRLVHLFYLGVYFPTSFRLAHEVIWEGVLAIAFISLWLGWLHWSNSHPSEFQHSKHLVNHHDTF